MSTLHETDGYAWSLDQAARLWCRMAERVTLAALPALALLAACNPLGPPAPAPDTKGQQMRAEVDRLARAYADCVAAGAKTVPVRGALAGTVAFRLQEACAERRAPLLAQVAAFHRFGHPGETAARGDAVAEASVKTLEDEIRSRAVVTIIQRQNPGKARNAA